MAASIHAPKPLLAADDPGNCFPEAVPGQDLRIAYDGSERYAPEQPECVPDTASVLESIFCQRHTRPIDATGGVLDNVDLLLHSFLY